MHINKMGAHIKYYIRIQDMKVRCWTSCHLWMNNHQDDSPNFKRHIWQDQLKMLCPNGSDPQCWQYFNHCCHVGNFFVERYSYMYIIDKKISCLWKIMPTVFFTMSHLLGVSTVLGNGNGVTFLLYKFISVSKWYFFLKW